MGKDRGALGGAFLSLLTFYRSKAFVHFNAISDDYKLCGIEELKDTYRLHHFDVEGDDRHLAHMPAIKPLIASKSLKDKSMYTLYSTDPAHVKLWFNI